MKASRLSWIDYTRGIAIILVCYRHVFEGSKEAGIPLGDYHFLEYINIFLFSFRMPLFFIISGLFIAKSLEKRGLKKYIETRARTIIYPYFLWGIFQITLQMIFTRYTNGHPTFYSYLNLLYQPRECAQFWYLYALFNVSVLYSFSKYFLKLSALHNILIGLVFFYLSALIYQKDIKTGFIFDILHYYIFFGIGDFLSGFLLNTTNRKSLGSGKVVLLMLLPFIACQSYFLFENLNHTTSRYMHVEFYEPFIFLLIALVGGAFIVSLAFYLQKKDILKWLTVLGRNSLYIYVSHVIVFAFVRIVLSKFLGVQNMIVILASGIISGLIVPLLLFRLSVKWNIPWLFTLEKQTREQDSTPLKDRSISPVFEIKK